MGTTTSPRILRLRALITHPRTGDAERAAAQRMLDRILAKSAHDTAGNRIYGSQHDRLGRHASLPSIAEMIGVDIQLARAMSSAPAQSGAIVSRDPIGDAPAGTTFSVQAPGDYRIVTTIDGLPRDWGWQCDNGIETASPALRGLADELAEIMDSYNHDGVDIEKRFFATVRARGETLVW